MWCLHDPETSLFQMGNSRMHVLFVRVYAHTLPLDANFREFLSYASRIRPLIALSGCLHLRGRLGPSRGI